MRPDDPAWWASIAAAVFLGYFLRPALDWIFGEVRDVRKENRQVDREGVERARHRQLDAVQQTRELVMGLADWLAYFARGEHDAIKAMGDRATGRRYPRHDLRLIGEDNAATAFANTANAILDRGPGAGLSDQDDLALARVRNAVAGALDRQEQRISDGEELIELSPAAFEAIERYAARTT